LTDIAGAIMAAIKGYFFPRLIVDESSGNQAPDRAAADSLSRVLSPLPVIKDNMTFQVLVLGTRGAGKTVFLASLFHLLSTQKRKGNNFILSCSDTKNLVQLRNVFNEISNPQKGWPPGTHTSQEYVFDCEHIKDDKKISLFRVRYYDFPGGYIAEGKSESELTFVLTQAKAAHAILVLLDGQKIRNLLENRLPSEGEKTIYNDLDDMIWILQQSVGKPLHFAITKSDILNPEVHSLTLIKQALLRHEQFRDLTEHNTRPIYLVPVSAVGRDFADFDPVDQEMKKRPFGRIKPLHVDMSLTFTLVDYLKQLSSRLKNGLPDDPHTTIVRNWVWRRVVKYSPALSPLALVPLVNHIGEPYWKPFITVNYMTQFMIGAILALFVTILLNTGGSKLKLWFEAWQSERDGKERGIHDRHLALETILQNQIDQALRFQQQHPDARLAFDESSDQ
jgi:hypothetical protein